MFAQFQTSYQRVEQALQRLTDSVAAYNPSVSAAEELAAADEAVTENLEKLVVHQRNHLRTEQLKRQAEAYDEQFRSTIKQIADTRKDLLAISGSSDDDEGSLREVSVDELLRYATFISRTTVPPTFRKQDVKLPAAKREEEKAQFANGTATPPAEVKEENGLPVKTEEMESTGMRAVKDSEKVWLAQKLPFEPWPAHLLIKQSALADVQKMVEAGRDPASVLSAAEQAEVDRLRAEEEERERQAQAEADRRRMSIFEGGGGRRRGPVDDVFNPDDI